MTAFNRRRWLFAGVSQIPIIVACGPHQWGRMTRAEVRESLVRGVNEILD